MPWIAPKHFIKTDRLGRGLLDEKPVHLGKLLRLLPNVAAGDEAAPVCLFALWRALWVPLKQIIRHENPALLTGILERLGQVAHVEILPRFSHQFPQLTPSKPHHLPPHSPRP